MFTLDHLVINVDEAYQRNPRIIEQIMNAGLPYKPNWGKGTKGFKASKIWIGNEYLEMVNILMPDGGGWKKEWVKLYNQGHSILVYVVLNQDNLIM